MSKTLLICLAVLCGVFCASAQADINGVAVSPAWFALGQHQQIEELNQEVAIGSRVTRVFVPWGIFEPKGPEISKHLKNELQFFLSAAHARHIKVVLNVSGAPCWAVPAPCHVIRPADPDLTLVGTLQVPNAYEFGRYAAYFAEHYGADIAAEEIGNEPNNPTFFAGSVDQYVRLLKSAYLDIKRVDPHLIVLGGAVEQANPIWIYEAYQDGMRLDMDALSVHAYGLSPGAFVAPQGLTMVQEAHKIMLASGDYRKLWITEFGYANCPSWFPFCLSNSQQAEWLVDEFQEDEALPYVAVAISYKLRDDTAPDGFGLLSTTFKRKPAYYSVQRFLRTKDRPLDKVGQP